MKVHEAVFLGCLALIVVLQTQTHHPPKLDGHGVAPLAVLPENWAAQPIDREGQQRWVMPRRPLQE